MSHYGLSQPQHIDAAWTKVVLLWSSRVPPRIRLPTCMHPELAARRLRSPTPRRCTPTPLSVQDNSPASQRHCPGPLSNALLLAPTVLAQRLSQGPASPAPFHQSLSALWRSSMSVSLNIGGATTKDPAAREQQLTAKSQCHYRHRYEEFITTCATDVISNQFTHEITANQSHRSISTFTHAHATHVMLYQGTLHVARIAHAAHNAAAAWLPGASKIVAAICCRVVALSAQ